MKMIFDNNDYTQLKDGETYEGKFIIISPDFFKPEYREAKCQLFLAKSGFGCDPSKLGGKIFGNFFDERNQTRREYVLGVATEDAIKTWEKLYGMSRKVFEEVEE